MTRFSKRWNEKVFRQRWIDIWRGWSEIRLSSLGGCNIIRFSLSRSCNLAHIVTAHFSFAFIVFPFSRECFTWSFGIWRAGRFESVNFENFFKIELGLRERKWKNVAAPKDKIIISFQLHLNVQFSCFNVLYNALIRCKIINDFIILLLLLLLHTL